MALTLLEVNTGKRETYSGNSMEHSIFSIYVSSASTRNCRWRDGVCSKRDRPMKENINGK